MANPIEWLIKFDKRLKLDEKIMSKDEAVNYLQLRLIMLNNGSGVRWSLKDRAAVSALCITSSKVNEVYEKYKHLDQLLSDPQFVDTDGNAMATVVRDLWMAIKL
jgi:hypothetical protein